MTTMQTMSGRVIAVDVDGVCADLHAEWLRRYNNDYYDDVKPADVTEWDITKAVTCGAEIFKYLRDPDLYDNINMIPGAFEGVRFLREWGHRVVFLTSCVTGMADQKTRWLVDHGFLEEAHSQRDLIIARDKSLIRADYLVDDYDQNFIGWMGHGILFDAPYNQNSTVVGLSRVYSWGHVLQEIARTEMSKEMSR